MASKLRSSSSCSFPSLLLSFLNLILFILCSSSLALLFLLKNPPTSFGWALYMISGVSLFSSIIGFWSHLTRLCFITHISLGIASVTGQILAILALFTREDSCLRSINSTRDPKEAKVLIRMECGALMGMVMMQLSVLLLSLILHCCWVREYQGLENVKEEYAKKRSRNMARVQEESMVNAAKIAEVRAKELDEKMKNKYGQWVNTEV
ncbi:hypothetical protein ACHQM5_028646 [Ranunculus cassubicifolius]